MLRPKSDLGSYYKGDSVPDWIFTVDNLTSSSVFDDAQLDVDDPDEVDFDLGSPSYTLAVVDTSTLTVTYAADSSKTFTKVGRYKGQLTLLIGTRKLSVQSFVFDVKLGPRAT